jgi:hypothetical protein
MQVTIAELAKKFKITYQRCRQLEVAGVFRNENRLFDLVDCAVGYTLFLRRGPGAELDLPVALEDLAKILGISKGTVLRLCREGCFVRLSHGRYDLAKSIENYMAWALLREFRRGYRMGSASADPGRKDE